MATNLIYDGDQYYIYIILYNKIIFICRHYRSTRVNKVWYVSLRSVKIRVFTEWYPKHSRLSKKKRKEKKKVFPNNKHRYTTFPI